MTLPQIRPLLSQYTDNIAHLSVNLCIIFVDEVDIEQKKIKNKKLIDLDHSFNGIISSLVALGDFEGKWLQNTSTLTFPNCNFSKRLTLIGAGKKQDFQPARARQLGLKSAEIALAFKSEKNALFLTSSLLFATDALIQVRLGFGMGIYKYPNSNMTIETKIELEKEISLTLVGTEPNSNVTEALNIAENLHDSINICRLFQDGAPNIVTPKYVAEHACNFAKNLKLDVQIFGVQKLRELGFNAMLAVGSGSSHEPQFVVIDYKPDSYKKTLSLVGKGLTMDTGGYSLKTPSNHQENMKYDMSGAAIVLASILAIARLKLPIRVFAVAALCENMIDAHSYRVGDILSSYSGKTIEVQNTDAEGRIVLSDALYYAAKDLKSDYIVEYSTLTGAVIVTLGHIAAGVFASHKDLESTIILASENTGERIHAMPVWEEIQEDIKGTISDLSNICATRGSAGSMSAAAFLNEFVADVPFAHIDIAGVADNNQAIGYPRKAGSGYGIQLSVEIAKELSKK